MDYLIKNADRFREGNEWKKPYWTVYGNEKPEGKVYDFLDKSNAFFIRNKGFDDMIAKLALALHVVIPSEKDFQDQAKKQYNKLQDALAKVQEKSQTSSGSSVVETPPQPKIVYDFLQSQPEILTLDSPQPYQDTSDTTLYLRAMVLHNDRYYQEALRLFQELIRRNPSNARYHNSCSVTLKKLGRYEEALAELLKAIELDPDNAWYHNNCSVTLHESGRYEGALTESQKAIALEPNNAICHNNCGVALYKMGRYEETLAVMLKALELEPDNAEYHNGCGMALYKMGRYEEALAEELKAISLASDNSWYHDILGNTLDSLQRYQEAVDAYNKALALGPKRPIYYKDLARTYKKMGLKKEAAHAKKGQNGCKTPYTQTNLR